MASLHDLRRAIFPTARPLGSTDPSPERGEQPVQWVRVLRSRVPAFESLDAGDLVVIPGPALAIVAPDTPRIDELADVLARAGLPAVLLVEGDAGSESLATLGAKVADAGVTAFWMERTDPAALERRIIRALIDGTRLGESTIELAAEDLTQPAYRPAVDRILRAVMDAPEGPYSARELLAPILVGRVQARQERIATLRAVLESGSAVEAATRLGVHRNTIAYRITRLEERTGWDLTDPDLRLALLLALRLVQDA
jgi:hypothetical protein